MQNFILRFDSFRKVPAELTNPTMHGAYLTILAYCFMGLLLIFEVHSYLSTNVTTSIEVDSQREEHIWIDFDVIMYELPCEYTKVVVRDIVGSQEIEVLEKKITKEIFDTHRGVFKGHLSSEKEELHQGSEDDDVPDDEAALVHHQRHAEEHPELESDWDSTSDQFKHSDFEAVLDYHDFTMVNFYAEWCIHCRRFAPTWKEAEQRSDKMVFRDKNRQPVEAKLLRVNCVDFGSLCARLGIRAYPTVRIYKKDKTFTQYTGPRQADPIVKFVQDFIHNQDSGKHEVVAHHSALEEGCRVHGELKVRRVPGFFLLEADSQLDSLDPAMTNVSHRVNHIFFVGDRTQLRDYVKSTAKHVTRDILGNMQPMKGDVFITNKAHTAPQHYIDVTPTRFDDQVVVYQSSVISHSADLEVTSVPQARFQFTFSSLAVVVSTSGRPLYNFLTSMMAIVGGTYTFISLIERFWTTVSARYKTEIGKIG